MRLAESAEQDAQHGVRVGGGAHRGAGVGTHPLLVDDDRCRQPFEDVDFGPRQGRHEALHEGAVGLVDQPLRLGGDGVEHQRALARAGDAGEHRQPALRDLDADVLEVVLPCAVRRGSFHGCRHRPARATVWSSSWPCSSCLHLLGGARFHLAASEFTRPESARGRCRRVGDGGNEAAAADVVRRLLHRGTRRGHLGQLRLDVRHVPVGHR